MRAEEGGGSECRVSCGLIGWCVSHDYDWVLTCIAKLKETDSDRPPKSLAFAALTDMIGVRVDVSWILFNNLETQRIYNSQINYLIILQV